MALRRSGFDRDALEVAPELLGMDLVHGPVRLRISEVEAYRGPTDSAAHTSMGRTARNTPVWGPAGHAYIYLCYGLHNMLNVVCAEGHCCLVRACEIVEGHDLVRRRRGGKEGPVLLTGPGKVGQALRITTALSGRDLLGRAGLRLLRGEDPPEVLAGPRVGIDYADPEHRDAPWRFARGGTRWVSQRKSLVSWEKCSP